MGERVIVLLGALELFGHRTIDASTHGRHHVANNIRFGHFTVSIQQTQKDLATLRIINCLKKTGMPIKEIKQFSAWLQKGDASLQQRYEMLLDRKREVEKQIADLQNVLKVINFKCWYYETAIAAGTEKIHTQNQPFPDDLCLDKWHKNEKRLVK